LINRSEKDLDKYRYFLFHPKEIFYRKSIFSSRNALNSERRHSSITPLTNRSEKDLDKYRYFLFHPKEMFYRKSIFSNRNALHLGRRHSSISVFANVSQKDFRAFLLVEAFLFKEKTTSP
jgi:hypothetical protein